jgi:hypothetical protein
MQTERLQSPKFQLASQHGGEINGFCLDPTMHPDAMEEYLRSSVNGNREVVLLKGRQKTVFKTPEELASLRNNPDRDKHIKGFANMITMFPDDFDMVCVYDVKEAPTSS